MRRLLAYLCIGALVGTLFAVPAFMTGRAPAGPGPAVQRTSWLPLQQGAPAPVASCSRCARPLTDGPLVIVDEKGDVAFRGCGRCLIDLIHEHDGVALYGGPIPLHLDMPPGSVARVRSFYAPAVGVLCTHCGATFTYGSDHACPR